MLMWVSCCRFWFTFLPVELVLVGAVLCVPYLFPWLDLCGIIWWWVLIAFRIFRGVGLVYAIWFLGFWLVGLMFGLGWLLSGCI